MGNCKRNCEDCRTYWCKRDEIYVCTGICEGRKAKGICGKTCATLTPGRSTKTEAHVKKFERKRKSLKGGK